MKSFIDRSLSRWLSGAVPFFTVWVLLASCKADDPSGLQGTYYSDDDLRHPVAKRVDPVMDLNWGLESPVEGLDATEHSIRWSGSITAPDSALYTFAVDHTFALRLRINGVLLVDTWYQPHYEETWKETDRFAQAQIALEAGKAYDIQLDFRKTAVETRPIEGRIALRWTYSNLPAEVVPSRWLSPAAVGSQPQVARSARHFYESVGVGVQSRVTFTAARHTRATPEIMEKSLAELDQLGLYSVRLSLFPAGAENPVFFEQMMGLHRDLGLKLAMAVREAPWMDGDADAMMKSLVDTAARARPALLFIEGPNEPFRGPERFQYRGHGYDRTVADKRVGDGWQKGIIYFMQDMSAALRGHPDTSSIPLASSSVDTSPWISPVGMQRVAEQARGMGIEMGDLVDYANVHKYHMDFPESSRAHDHLRHARKEVADLRKPFVSTETGYNTGGRSHDRLNGDEHKHAEFLLRNYLFCFNLGFKHTYDFALRYSIQHEEGFECWGLLREDMSRKPAYNALKLMLDLVRDQEPASNWKPASLDYHIDTPEPLPGVYTSLFQRSDGVFILALWQGMPGYENPATVNLKFGSPVAVEMFLPTQGGDKLAEYPSVKVVPVPIGSDPVFLTIQVL